MFRTSLAHHQGAQLYKIIARLPVQEYQHALVTVLNKNTPWWWASKARNI